MNQYGTYFEYLIRFNPSMSENVYQRCMIYGETDTVKDLTVIILKGTDLRDIPEELTRLNVTVLNNGAFL